MKKLALLIFVLLLAACGQLNGDVLTLKTADPNLAVAVKLLPAPSLLPTVTPTPCEPVIKGNINAQGEKIAHSPGQSNYENTQVDESKGEKWFCTLEEAVAEGWRPALR